MNNSSDPSVFRSLRRMITYLIGGVAVLAFVLILRSLFELQTQRGESGAPSADSPFDATYLSSEGSQDSPVWSSDGRYIAYTSRHANGNKIMRYDVQTGETTLIASDAYYVVWSPSGSQLAYLRFEEPTHTLYMSGSDGVDPIEVADAEFISTVLWSADGRSLLFTTYTGDVYTYALDQSALQSFHLENVDGLLATSLSPDGAHLFALVNQNLGFPQSIDIDLANRSYTSLAVADSDVRMARWSPDGQTFAYQVGRPNQMPISIRVVSSNGASSYTIDSAQPAIWSLGAHEWSPDASFIAYTTQTLSGWGGAYVSWVDGSRSVPLLPGAQINSLAWSPDGTQIALSVFRDFSTQEDIAIVRADEASLLARLDALQATPTPPPLPTPEQPFPSFTPCDIGCDSLPTPFPTPTPPSAGDFYRIQRLTTHAGFDARPVVSPDGRYIAFASERDGNWDIYRFDRSTGEEVRLSDDALNDMAPAWSPDGSRIAYQHNVPSDAGPVLVDRIVMNADGSGKVAVSSGAVWNGNEAPAWSPSGRRIAFSASGRIHVIDVSSASEIVQFDAGGGFYSPSWKNDDNTLIFLGVSQGALIGDINTGMISSVPEVSVLAQTLLWSNVWQKLAYFASTDQNIQELRATYLDGAIPELLASGFGAVGYSAWSPDGRFIAYYAGDSIHVAFAYDSRFGGQAPMFSVPSYSAPTDLLSLAWLPDGSGFVYVGSQDGQPDLYLATINEDTVNLYMQVTGGPPPTALPFPTPILAPTAVNMPNWLQIHPQGDWRDVAVSGQHIWLTNQNDGGVYSIDGGATWAFANLNGLLFRFEPSRNFAVDQTVYAATLNGIYRSSDGGSTWQTMLSGTGETYTSIDSADDGTLFVTSQGPCQIAQSHDGGVTWQQQPVDFCPFRIVAAPQYANNHVLYALSGAGLSQSRDAGNTWQSIDTLTPLHIAFDPTSPSVMYIVWGSGEVARSNNHLSDRREDWQYLPIGQTSAIAVAPDGRLIVGTVDGRVYESIDRGDSWSEISTFSFVPVIDLAVGDNVVYIVMQDGQLVGGYREGALIPATPTPIP